MQEMTTHTSYKFSKKLNAFLGENAPEPMVSAWWVTFGSSEPRIIPNETAGKIFPAAYQLHDLLSKPFCEVMERKVEKSYFNYGWRLKFCQDMANEYYHGGLPAVEKALMEMMEGK